MVQQTALTALRHEEARLSYRIGVKKDLSSVGVFKPRVIHVGRDDFRIGAFPDFSCIRHRPPLSLSLSLSFKTSFASMMGERARALFGARLKSNPLAISLSSSPRPPASRDTRNAYRFIVMSNHPPFHREGGGGRSCPRSRRSIYATKYHPSSLLFLSLISFLPLFALSWIFPPLDRRSYALIAPGTRLRRKSRPFASLMQIKIVPEMSLRGSWRVIAQLAEGAIRFSSCRRNARVIRARARALP